MSCHFLLSHLAAARECPEHALLGMNTRVHGQIIYVLLQLGCQPHRIIRLQAVPAEMHNTVSPLTFSLLYRLAAAHSCPEHAPLGMSTRVHGHHTYILQLPGCRLYIIIRQSAAPAEMHNAVPPPPDPHSTPPSPPQNHTSTRAAQQRMRVKV